MTIWHEVPFHGALEEEQSRAAVIQTHNDRYVRDLAHSVVIVTDPHLIAQMSRWQRWLNGEDVTLTGSPEDFHLPGGS